MRRVLDRAAMEATTLLLAAGIALILASLGGVGGAPLLAGLFAALSAVLFAARDRLPKPGFVAGHDLSQYVADLWIAAALATVTTLYLLGSTPGELQTAGGVLGLLGMANYFLRPVYQVIYSLFATLQNLLAPGDG